MNANNKNLEGTNKKQLKKRNRFLIILLILVAFIITQTLITKHGSKKAATPETAYPAAKPVDSLWRGKKESQIITSTDSGRLIKYGHELISNTSYYLGPRGKVARISNGMNCQNCHLFGGTSPYAGNFGKVYANFPQFRARNNGLQSIYDRINDCFERSMNGKAMDRSTKEMRALYAYFKWIGEEVPKGEKPAGTVTIKLKYMDVAADPVAGRKVYMANCQVCHGNQGQGMLKEDKTGYTFPPLWGADSFNDGAGMYRVSTLAAFVKVNMPFGTNYKNPKLTDKEAWDVAAFINSQPRPHKDQSMDWKDIRKKPIDYPWGPYPDTFSEKQHKYGPFQPIKDFQDSKTKTQT